MSTRRDEIVDIARELFAEKGYAATSTRDIAEACGLLAGSLYSHFRSKAQMLELAVGPFHEELNAAMREAAEQPGTGAARVETMIRKVVALCSMHPAELRILHYDWPNIQAAEELREVQARSTETLDIWHKLVNAGIEDGSLRPDVQPEVALRVITSAVHGVLDRARYGTRVDLLQELGLEPLTDQLVTMLLDGMLAASPTR
jgi:AcrR family transcriptional regulator